MTNDKIGDPKKFGDAGALPLGYVDMADPREICLRGEHKYHAIKQ